jgi:hypothetical protein
MNEAVPVEALDCIIVLLKFGFFVKNLFEVFRDYIYENLMSQFFNSTIKLSMKICIYELRSTNTITLVKDVTPFIKRSELSKWMKKKVRLRSMNLNAALVF